MKKLSFFEEQYNSAVAAKDKHLFQAGICGLFAAVFLLLTLLSLPRIVLAVFQLMFCVFLWVLCREEMTQGIRAFLKFSPTADSFLSLAVIAQIAHAVRMMVSEPPNGNFYASVLFVSAALSMLMKSVYQGQIIRNLDLVRDKKTHALQVADLTLSKKYISRVCSAAPMEDFPNLFRTSSERFPGQKIARKFVPLTFLGVLAASVLLQVYCDGLFFSAFSALLTVCASFTAEAAFMLPYILTQIRLRKAGSILLGNRSLEGLRDTDTLLVKDRDLFPPKENTILRLQARAGHPEAARYIAALLKITDSPLEEGFLESEALVADSLPPVVQWHIIKNYGVVATVHADRVLFGNRNLLISHNVTPWGADKEAVLTASQVHLLYLVVNGEIAATLAVRYGEDPEIKKSVEGLRSDFQVLVETRDCHINESMIRRRYDLSRIKISLPDPDELDSVMEAREELEDDSAPPVMLSTKSPLASLDSICRIRRLEKAVELSQMTHRLSILFGLILTALSLFFTPAALSWVWLMGFQLIWSIPVAVIAVFAAF